MLCPVEWVTADGYDLQFMTNVLGTPALLSSSLAADLALSEGPFLFTKLLMTAILAGAETHPDHHSRIIEISSSASHLCSDIKLDTFKDGPERRRLSPIEHYSQSKLVSTLYVRSFRKEVILDVTQANFVIARQYAKRYADRGVVSIALNPGEPVYVVFYVARLISIGNIDTDLLKNFPRITHRLMVSLTIVTRPHSN